MFIPHTWLASLSLLTLSLARRLHDAINNATPPSGLIDKCTEKEIRSVVDGMVEQGLDKLGYRFINM
jgi:hypothetical protein